MIRIDDACKVCKEIMINHSGDQLNEELAELIYNEMEQKVWITDYEGQAREVLKDIMDLITDINPEEILNAIKEGKLLDWCTQMQVNMNLLLVRLPIEHEKE